MKSAPTPGNKSIRVLGVPVIVPTPGMMAGNAIALGLAGLLFPVIFPEQTSVAELELFLSVCLGIYLVRDCCQFDRKTWPLMVPFMVVSSTLVWPFIHLCAVLGAVRG